MGKHLEIVLPMPPSVNSYWRSVTTRDGRTRVLISKQGRQWKKAATRVIQLQRMEKIGGELEVVVVWYFRRRGSDVDNPCKVLLDFLQGWAYENDVQITDLHLHKRYDSGNPRCVVLIQPAAADTPEAHARAA